ncbi:MAG: hypothetical protein ACJASL_003885 [Paraglaciecola sp.]|jgi:hypothetical protein
MTRLESCLIELKACGELISLRTKLNNNVANNFFSEKKLLG